MLACMLEGVGLGVLCYVVLLLMPVLGRMVTAAGGQADGLQALPRHSHASGGECVCPSVCQSCVLSPDFVALVCEITIVSRDCHVIPCGCHMT